MVGHILKHTFVSWMLQAGKSHEDIALIVNTTPGTLRDNYVGIKQHFTVTQRNHKALK